MKPLRWHETPDAHAQARDLAAALTATLAAAVQTHGDACLAVSGGRSPGLLFDVLCQADLPWARIHIILVDERCAPAGPEDRNETLVRQRLLRGPAAAARFTPPLDGEAPATPPARIDALVLGMGPDGHTASLFPDATELPAALDPEQAPAYVFINPPAAPWHRISLNLRAILDAGHVFIAISGDEKRRVLEHAATAGLAGPPIGAVLARASRAPDIHWCP